MRPDNDALSWSTIHRLEVAEEYPSAIKALEQRLAKHPNEPESVVRLGFNLWYAVVEEDRMGLDLLTEQYADRFMRLYAKYKTELASHADFCWVFGLGMSMFWYYFPKATEEEGKRLIERAKQLDPFWRDIDDLARFRGRGIFQSYYGAA